MRLHTIALGCQMSAADAGEMSSAMAARGFKNVAELNDADAVILSTCTVRQHAEDRALSMIGRLSLWKEANPERLLIVAGCAAERLKDTLQKRFPAIDLVVGAKSIEDFPKIIDQALGHRFNAPAENREAFTAMPHSNNAHALPAGEGMGDYVTIMRGCNYSCSYCIVPAVRGRELYRPVADILAEARLKIDRGASAIMLLGQTVNSYGSIHEGRDISFGGLLRLVDKIAGLRQLRFMSPHPHYVDEPMISAMAECPRVENAIHLPVQSGSDRILKLMRRNYTRASYLEKIGRMRRAIPGIVLSTDIIVGFPTETEEEFAESLSLLEEMEAASAYTFKYSPRRSTLAASWPDDVPGPVKEERLERLNKAVKRLKEAK